MDQPTPVSVTKAPCSCGYLASSAREPNLPVKFDSKLNEYSLEIRLPKGTALSIVLYHCPRCGGVASKSKRNQLFLKPSAKEVRRLESMVRNLKTIDDIRRSLGTPDAAETIRLPSDFRLRGRERKVRAVKVLTYTKLSRTADLQFTVYSHNSIEGVIAPKSKQK